MVTYVYRPNFSLLAFFIMMFSMSTIKMSAWDVFKGSLDNEKRLEASPLKL